MIRLGLIGCGNMCQHFVERFGRVGPRVRVTAAVDLDRSRAEHAAHAFGNARAATDYREVLDDIDAALLVLPHHVHHRIGVDCLEAGKHVLVEKPLANTERDCREMIEAAQRSRRVMMVAYVMRYHPLVLAMKEALDSGRWGRCFHMAIWTEQFTRFNDDHWSNNARLLGGGQLFSHGCHYVDLLLWFLGRPIEGHHVGTRLGTPWMQGEGTSNIAMRFESGAVGYHFGTWGARGTRLGYAIHAHCEEGMLEADFATGRLLLHQFKFRQGLVEPHIDGHKGPDSDLASEQLLFQTATGKQTDKELTHFLDCIETGQRPLTDGPRSLQSLRVIWRMYEAEKKGQIADLRGLGLDEISPSRRSLEPVACPQPADV